MLSDVMDLRKAWAGLLSLFLFVVSGILGATFFLDEIKAESNWIYIVPALPFGVVCAFSCMRAFALASAAAAVYCLVWAAAFYIGAYLCGHEFNPFIAMLPAGLVGGAGVAAVTSLDAPHLRALLSVAAAGGIGAIVALPFALYAKPLEAVPLSQDAILEVSFVIWQVAVGMYVYRACGATRVISAAA